MSVINKIRIDGTTYDIEDASLTAKVNALNIPYSNSETYEQGSIGEAVKNLEDDSEVASNADIAAALYS